MDVQERVAVVTGGAQGIGKAMCQRFLAAGLVVALVDSDRQAGRETVRALATRAARFIHCDVADEQAVRATMRAVAAEHGGIDVLVNNAGIERRTPLARLSRAAWDRVLAVNLTGAMLCARHAAPALRRRRGAIINIASTRARQSEPDCEAYAASKGGLVALTHALAVSLGPDIRVNCISPGWIEVGGWKKSARRRPAALSSADHRQHPAGRVGRPEDVAALAWFLASPDSGFITGAELVIDGGMTRRMIYV